MPRCSEDIVALADVITTHALFARKVQRKLSNGVAGFGPGGSSLDRQKSRAIRASSQRCRSMTNVCARTPRNAGTGPELRTPGAAAQRECSLWPEFSRIPGNL